MKPVTGQRSLGTLSGHQTVAVNRCVLARELVTNKSRLIQQVALAP